MRANNEKKEHAGSWRRLLYQPEDSNSLSELICLVRQQIEVFVATPDDVDSRNPRGGIRDHVDVGRVGIRCIHCTRKLRSGNLQREAGSDSASASSREQKKQPKLPERGAVSYPKAVRLVYQSVRNWQRYHLLTCTDMPADVKEQYMKFKNYKCRRRSATTSAMYWEEQCRQMGMIDTDKGIRLSACGTAADGSGSCADGNSTVDTSTAGTYNEGQNKTSTEAADAVVNSQLDIRAADYSPGRKAKESSIEPADIIISQADPANNLLDPPAIDFSSLDGCSQEESTAASTITLERSDEPLHMDQEVFSTLMTSHNSSHSQQTTIADWCGASSTFNSFAPTSSIPFGLLNLGGTVANNFHGYRRDNTCDNLGTALTKEEVLQRVKMAHSSVLALRTMRELPPSHTSDRSNATGAPRVGNLDEDQRVETLMLLGAELYKLFSDPRPPEQDGRSCIKPHSKGTAELLDHLISEDNSSNLEPPQQQQKYNLPQPKKKGKLLPEMEEQKKFVQMTERGVPSALCTLVSNLLNAKMNKDRDHCDYYSCVEEVEEDLCVMAESPDRFLFDSYSAGGDLHLHLNFPQDMLYGRKGEVSKLLKAYDRTVNCTAPCGKNEMVLISGYSGTGKSSIVYKVQGHFIERGACFISGKFDVMRQVRPLSAIVGALNEYCGLLAGDIARIDQVKEAVSEAVGGDARVLADLIPNLSKIINIPSVPSMQASGREALQRLMFLFRMLLRATCSRTHPIVLFLDDLQWADDVSLELMHVLVTDSQIHGLLFVGCYRDNEVSPEHPLMQHLNEITRSGGASITSIHIGNLDHGSINTLLTDVLRMVPRMTRSLAEEVLHKTGGNALFVVQFIVSLCDVGLLRFSLTRRRWEWDINGIRSRNIADNVVELMTVKLVSLAPAVHEALKVAAGFGALCQKALLHILDRDPCRQGNTATALDVVVGEGLMVKVEEGAAYRFSHDQIQSAAYLLIPKSEREAFHLSIGRSLWRLSSADEMNAHLFVVVDQLHRGAGVISDHDERLALAELSLKAGQKAAAMSAFLPASVYLKAGISLIANNDWEHHRQLCLSLCNSCAEMQYILGDFDGMKGHLEQVLLRARTLEEKLRPYSTLVQSMVAQGDTRDAIDTTITVLSHLGESLTLSATKAEVMREVLATQEVIQTRTEDVSVQLETLKDSEKKQAMKFLKIIASAFYTERRDIFPVVICRMVRLSLLHGVCSESAIGFAYYGILLCGLLGDYAGGIKFGKLALSIVEKFHAKDSQASTHALVYGFINNWTEPIQSSMPCLQSAADVGLANGDTEYAMLSAHLYTGTALCSGHPLGPLYEEMQVYSKQMVEYRQHYIWTYNAPLRQTTLNLLGKAPNPIKLIGEEMDEDNLLENAENVRNETFVSVNYFYRMWLEYLFGEYELAAETAKKNPDLAKHIVARFPVVCNQPFIHGLTALALARKGEKEKFADIIDRSMEQMMTWAESTPWNCRHKLELMKAEYAYMKGDFVVAAETYDLAADLAEKHHFIHEKALALERAGIFYFETSDHVTASGYFAKACDCYSQWGACSKVAHIQERYIDETR